MITESHLEMLARPEGHCLEPPLEGLEIRLIEEPPLAFYRSLFTTVGRPWRWLNRMQLPDEELRAQLHAPGRRLYVPYLDGLPVGLMETSFAAFPEVELLYFGLAPGYLGRGIGPYLLDWLIAQAWDAGASRLWLKTCTDDSPQALGVYERAGFRVFRRLDKEKTYDPARW